MNQYLLTYLVLGIIPTVVLSIWWHKKWIMKILFFFILYPLYPLFIALWVWNMIRGVRNNVKCAWCGEAVNFKNQESIKEHVKNCKEHPTLTRIAELEAELAGYREDNDKESKVYEMVLDKKAVNKIIKRSKKVK